MARHHLPFTRITFLSLLLLALPACGVNEERVSFLYDDRAPGFSATDLQQQGVILFVTYRQHESFVNPPRPGLVSQLLHHWLPDLPIVAPEFARDELRNAGLEQQLDLLLDHTHLWQHVDPDQVLAIAPVCRDAFGVGYLMVVCVHPIRKDNVHQRWTTESTNADGETELTHHEYVRQGAPVVVRVHVNSLHDGMAGWTIAAEAFVGSHYSYSYREGDDPLESIGNQLSAIMLRSFLKVLFGSDAINPDPRMPARQISPYAPTNDAILALNRNEADPASPHLRATEAYALPLLNEILRKLITTDPNASENHPPPPN